MHHNDPDTGNSERGSSRNVLLGILAALSAVFGYLYFFTGVIVPRGETPPPPPERQQQVKQPIPPRPDTQPTPKTAESPPAQPQAVPPAHAPKPAVPAAAKPSETQPKPQPAPPKQAQPAVQQPSPQPQKPAPAAKPAPPAQQPAPRPAAAQVKPEAPKSAAKDSRDKVVAAKQAASFRIATGDTVSSQKADKIVEQLKKGGLGSVKKETVRANRPMNRLFMAAYADRDAAAAELEKLRRLSAGAFILPSGGTYELYAGSYDREAGAESEKKRLESHGLKPVLRKASVSLPVFRVTAVASSREMADESLRMVKKLGLDAAATGTGK